MKITYCINSLYNPGGMERVLSIKVNYLVQKKNYDITIITTDQKNRTPFFTLDKRIKLIDLGLNYSDHYNQPLIKKYITYRIKQKKYSHFLESYLKNNKVDICMSLCGKEIDFLYKLKVIGTKKMAELHFAKKFRSQFADSNNKSFIWKLLGYIRTLQLERATKSLSKLIVLTKEDEKDWSKTHSNIVQIYNPLTFETIKEAPLNTKSAITVGRLDAQKGFDYLIDIWALVVKKHPDWVLNIWGGGIWEDKLSNQIKKNGLENKVYLRGVTDNIQDEYLNNSMYLMTSRYEGFGMVLTEASTFGLPLVSFDCNHGPSEIIKNGYNGYLVKELDFEGMANRICYLIENESIRKEMGHNSKTSSHKFSLDTIMDKWIKLFNV
jgi:glycosyltransferase involved in cell wall biosynthesis